MNILQNLNICFFKTLFVCWIVLVLVWFTFSLLLCFSFTILFLFLQFAANLQLYWIFYSFGFRELDWGFFPADSWLSQQFTSSCLCAGFYITEKCNTNQDYCDTPGFNFEIHFPEMIDVLDFWIVLTITWWSSILT